MGQEIYNQTKYLIKAFDFAERARLCRVFRTCYKERKFPV